MLCLILYILVQILPTTTPYWPWQASTGVENGQGGGFERINGDHAVTLRGRTYHYLGHPNSWKGGISYFTHDSVQAAVEHGKGLNTAAYVKVIPQILAGL